MFVAVVLLLKEPVGSVGFLVKQDMAEPSNDHVTCSEVSDHLDRHSNGRLELPETLVLAQLGTTGESQKVRAQYDPPQVKWSA